MMKLLTEKVSVAGRIPDTESEKCNFIGDTPSVNIFTPDRPAPLSTGMPQSPLGSYYTPDALMFHSWSPTAFQPREATGRIAIFGASTIAGDGIRCSENTIPSIVQRLLSDRVPDQIRNRVGGSPQVDNFGQSAYVAYNQYLLLLNQLRYGYRPQLVIFFEGQNDALQSVLKASPHFSYGEYSNGAMGLFGVRYSLRESLLARSALFRLLVGEFTRTHSLIVEGDNYKPAVFQGSFDQLTSTDAMSSRVDSVVTDMVSQAEMIGILAAEYKFDLLIINNPSILSKVRLSEREGKIMAEVKDIAPQFLKAISLTQDAMDTAFRAVKHSRIHYLDLRRCSGHSADEVFRDISHLTPAGNEILATCIYSGLSRLSIY